LKGGGLIKITIVDYGMGNLRSVYNAIKFLGGEPILVSSPDELNDGKIIIPGVGAFGDGMKNFTQFVPKISEAISSGAPVLGICLGLHMLFEKSEESPDVRGIGAIKGEIIKIRTKLKLPHMGWNFLNVQKKSCPLFKGIGEGYAYFVHSYHAWPKVDVVAATTDYGEKVTAAIWDENIFGTQFHPEKSGAYGLKILKNFMRL